MLPHGIMVAICVMGVIFVTGIAVMFFDEGTEK